MTVSREAFKAWLTVPTRWEDFDAYGHVNNVKYYAYFDTVINEYLIAQGGLNPVTDSVVGYVAESHCTFHGSFVFPEIIEAGLSVEKLGNSSVRYALGLFRQGEREARAIGYCVHVFVDRSRESPTPIPAALRAALQAIAA
jgi:acyl-CoA thioester hydrolase